MITQHTLRLTFNILNDYTTHITTHFCGRTGYTGPTGRTGPCPDPSDPTAYCTNTSPAQLLASSSLLVEVILASSLEPVTN